MDKAAWMEAVEDDVRQTANVGQWTERRKSIVLALALVLAASSDADGYISGLTYADMVGIGGGQPSRPLANAMKHALKYLVRAGWVTKLPRDYGERHGVRVQLVPVEGVEHGASDRDALAYL